MRPSRLVIFAPLLLVLSPSAVNAATYTVGTGTGCTHPTIQQAVNAAQAAPSGANTIHITRSLSYSAQAVVINTAQELSLVGGFATCTQATSDGNKTTIKGGGASQAPVLRITGQTGSVIRLRDLRIEDGSNPCCDGGGIYYSGTGRLIITDTDILGNTAGYGAGIYARSPFGLEAELVIGENVLVMGNTAVFSGGGVYIEHVKMLMLEPNSAIGFNTAQGQSGRGFGGGLMILDAHAVVGSGGTGTQGTIFGNSARYGGGVAVVSDGGYPQLDLFSTRPDQRTSIAANWASVVGGGIYVRPQYFRSARASIWNADLLLNDAPDGAAVYLEDDTELWVLQGSDLRINAQGLPAGALPCPFDQFCGRVAYNRTLDALGEPTSGAIIRANRDALIHIGYDGADGAPARRGGVEFTGNAGGRLIDIADNNDASQARLYNVVIHGNALSQELLRAAGGGSVVDIEDSTIAGNSIGAARVLSVDGNVRLRSTLIWQPGRTMLTHSGGSRTVDWSMANEVASLGGAPGATQIAGPRFVDPERGDYRLRAASPAIDRASPTGAGHRDAHSRLRDLALPVPWSGQFIRDIGAFERPSISQLTLNPNFNADLHLWPEVTVGASTWDGSQNAAGPSGSVFVNQSDVPQRRVVARRQCIHLPAPGRYELNGWGRSGAGTPGVRDTVLLNWQLRHNGGEACTAGNPDRQGDHILTTANSWQRPAVPAEIIVADSEWTTSSSLAVQLVVHDNGITPPLTVTGWFDGINLVFIGEIGPDIFANGFE